MRMLGLSLAAIAIVIVTACGGSSDNSTTTGPGNNPGPGTGPANPNTVSLVDSSFNPTSLAIKVGQTVTWVWAACSDTTSGYGYGNGQSCISHQIQFDDGSGTQSPMQNTGTFNRTFTAAGTFKYHCTVHGSYMSGQITVQ